MASYQYSSLSPTYATPRISAMSSKLLYGGIAVLMIDSIMELSFLSSMVSWLHVRAGKAFEVNNPAGGQFSLHGKPENLLLNQGHASNGASGTAFIVVGLGGILALWLRQRQIKRSGSISGFTSFLYNFWLYMTAISAVYTLACLIYVMVVTYSHNGQTINVNVASKLNNHPYPNYVAYPLQSWAPQNWFTAVLELDLVSKKDRSNIQEHLNVMKAWQWNLIPMTIIGIVVAALAFMERMQHRQGLNKAAGSSRLEAARQKNGSPYS